MQELILSIIKEWLKYSIPRSVLVVPRDSLVDLKVDTKNNNKDQACNWICLNRDSGIRKGSADDCGWNNIVLGELGTSRAVTPIGCATLAK